MDSPISTVPSEADAVMVIRPSGGSIGRAGSTGSDGGGNCIIRFIPSIAGSGSGSRSEAGRPAKEVAADVSSLLESATRRAATAAAPRMAANEPIGGDGVRMRQYNPNVSHRQEQQLQHVNYSLAECVERGLVPDEELRSLSGIMKSNIQLGAPFSNLLLPGKMKVEHSFPLSVDPVAAGAERIGVSARSASRGAVPHYEKTPAACAAAGAKTEETGTSAAPGASASGDNSSTLGSNGGGSSRSRRSNTGRAEDSASSVVSETSGEGVGAAPVAAKCGPASSSNRASREHGVVLSRQKRKYTHSNDEVHTQLKVSNGVQGVSLRGSNADTKSESTSRPGCLESPSCLAEAKVGTSAHACQDRRHQEAAYKPAGHQLQLPGVIHPHASSMPPLSTTTTPCSLPQSSLPRSSRAMPMRAPQQLLVATAGSDSATTKATTMNGSSGGSRNSLCISDKLAATEDGSTSMVGCSSPLFSQRRAGHPRPLSPVANNATGPVVDEDQGRYHGSNGDESTAASAAAGGSIMENDGEEYRGNEQDDAERRRLAEGGETHKKPSSVGGGEGGGDRPLSSTKRDNGDLVTFSRFKRTEEQRRRNGLSAKKHRDRRKLYLEFLVAEVEALRSQASQFTMARMADAEVIRALEQENAALWAAYTKSLPTNAMPSEQQQRRAPGGEVKVPSQMLRPYSFASPTPPPLATVSATMGFASSPAGMSFDDYMLHHRYALQQSLYQQQQQQPRPQLEEELKDSEEIEQELKEKKLKQCIAGGGGGG
eukprot:GHVU01203380.1.p1 GENE.GHVU01203380.1~~GHVU01203380.1.p1  ORF type:complete len:768 (+),score=112.05 GHVU01203380.1:181-2484(+)